MGVPLNDQRYPNGPTPAATTLNVAFSPAITVLLTGAVLTIGANTGSTTEKVWAADWLSPLLAVPPSSRNTTDTSFVPAMLTAGLNVKTPAALMLGCTSKKELFVVEMMNVSAWPVSLGPLLMF